MVKESIETILTYTSNLLHKVSIIAVNDRSNDSTEHVLQQIANRDEDNKLILLSHQNNKGYGAALNTGINYALLHKYDYALFMDSDLTNHPKYINLVKDTSLNLELQVWHKLVVIVEK